MSVAFYGTSCLWCCLSFICEMLLCYDDDDDDKDDDEAERSNASYD